MGVRARALRARHGRSRTVAVLDQPVVALPATPFRGIDPFRYADHAIFFARGDETRQLSSLVAVYRGVLLYGDSGAGKSSLINAGLLPRTSALGFLPERVRVQPRRHEELVVERIATAEDSGAFLPSVLASAEERSQRVVLSTEVFEERVRAACAGHRLLIVFDQFEELVTLFEEQGERDAQQRIMEMLVRLLREPLPVKFLFSFREDYLGRVKELLRSLPELVDQSLRLAPPSADALPAIIRGPFEEHPGHFGHELAPALADRLRDALAERFGSGEVSLSEVETVCLRLWQSPDPERLLSTRGVQGLLEDYLGEALTALTPELRTAAIAVLSQMVTAAGTRNVVSAEDVVQRVRAEDRRLREPVLRMALERLERESRLVRRERRRDLYLYEITSEFIVPWISRRRDDLRRQHERRRDRRRLILLGLAVVVLGAIATVVTILAIDADQQRREAREQTELAERQKREAERQATAAESLALTMAAQRAPGTNVPLVLSLAAYDRSEHPDARSALVRALQRARQSGVQRIMHGHDGNVYGVAVSRDGHTIASAGADRTVRLWDIRSHGDLAVLKGHRGIVGSVAFSPDGRTLASADVDEKIRLWEVPSGKSLGVLQGRGGAMLNSLAFTRNGQLISAGANGTIVRWDVRRGREVDEARVGRGGGFSSGAAFSRHARLFAFAGRGGRVVVWDVRRGEPLPGGTLRVPKVTALALSPDGRTLAAARLNKRLELFDVRSRERLGSPLRTHTDSVYGLAFSTDGRTIAAKDTNETVGLWHVRRDEPLGTRLTLHTGDVIGLAFAPRRDSVVSANEDGTVVVSNLRRAESFGRPRIAASTVFGAALSQTVAAVSDGSRIRLWDLRSGERLPRLPKERISGYYASLALSRDGRTLGAARANGTIRVWDVQARKLLGPRLKAQMQYPELTLSDDGRRLATASRRVIRIWDLPSGTPHAPLKTGIGSIMALALSPDGNTIAVASAKGRVRVWDVREREELGRPRRTDTTYVEHLGFSPDGRRLGSAGFGETIALWDTASLQRSSRLLTGHIQGASVIAFSPDGYTIAAGGDDGRIRLWDLRNRRQLGTALAGHEDGVESLEFSADGTTLFSNGLDGRVRAWHGVLWKTRSEVQKQVCRIVGTGLSRSEWALHVADVEYARACP